LSDLLANLIAEYERDGVQQEFRMAIARKILVILLIVSGVGFVLWIGLDAVMRGVAEMEKNMGGARQAVKDDRVKTHGEFKT
jgi:hypothetical protein